MKQKIHIKHLFAFRHNLRHGNADIAILTDDNQYIEYSLEFRKMYLSRFTSKRIRSLFEPYVIDKNTDIAVNELLDDNHPLYLYFMFLRQHIGFKCQVISKDRITSRIFWRYTSKAATKSKFNKAWKLVIEHGECPWITQQIEYALQNKGPTEASRVRQVRMAMFYLVVKNYLYRIVKKSKDKKKNKQDFQTVES